MKKIIIASLLLSLLSIGCTHDPIEISPPDTRLNWFNDAKFGMFIHWGVYSGMAGKYVGPSLYGTEYTAGQSKAFGAAGKGIPDAVQGPDLYTVCTAADPENTETTPVCGAVTGGAG